jgi:ATP-dependent Clp protease ATP-binding subunit ClpC
VVLFDEIEKANPDVFNILLQILEDGQLTDAAGKRVNFANTVIIMTSNLGMQELNQQAARIGFADRDAEGAKPDQERLQKEYDDLKDKILETLKHDFRPEFINRIDRILVYRPLGFDQLKKITILQIADLQKRLTAQNVELKATQALVKFIAEKSFDPAQGARFIRKNVQDLIGDPLAEKIIAANLREGGTVSADFKNGKVTFHIQHKREKVPIPA